MRILLISPSFFGYRESIARAFRRMNHEVDVISDRPSDGVVYKSIFRVYPSAVAGMVRRHADQIFSVLKDMAYDLVLYVGGSTFPFSAEQFKPLREASSALFVAYIWDSFERCSRFIDSSMCFDQIYSFNPSSFSYIESIYLPLFYRPEYESICHDSLSSCVYDACFIGSVHHPEKFENVLTIIDSIKQHNGRVFSYFYMPSRSSALVKYLEAKVYRRGDVSFQFRPLDVRNVISVLANSACVIDAPVYGQQGLTMRSIEAIGSGRKLITSNQSIRSSDLYSYGDIFLFGSHDLGKLASFVSDRVRHTPDSVRAKYSLDSWAEQLLHGISSNQ